MALVGEDREYAPRGVQVHGDGRFFGALDLMPHQRILRTAVAIRDGEVLRVPAERLRSLLIADAELRDLLARSFLLREAIGPQLTTDLCVLAFADDPRTPQLQAWAARHGLSARFNDPSAFGDAQQAIARLGFAAEDLPVVLMPDGTLLRKAGVAEVERVYVGQPGATGSAPR